MSGCARTTMDSTIACKVLPLHRAFSSKPLGFFAGAEKSGYTKTSVSPLFSARAKNTANLREYIAPSIMSVSEVEVGLREDGETLPLIVRPAQGDDSVDFLKTWVSRNAGWLDAKILQHGASSSSSDDCLFTSLLC